MGVTPDWADCPVPAVPVRVRAKWRDEFRSRPPRARGNYEFSRRSGACFLNDSAIRVCHPVPLAFQRSKTSGATLKLIATFEFGDLGRPRGLSISAAVLVPYRLGNTSRAGRAREKSSFVHSGFSSLTRDFLFFLITSDLTPIHLA